MPLTLTKNLTVDALGNLVSTSGYRVHAGSGTAPFTWTLTGEHASHFRLDDVDGEPHAKVPVCTNIPTSSAVKNFTVRVMDSKGLVDEASLTWSISVTGAIVLEMSATLDGSNGFESTLSGDFDKLTSQDNIVVSVSGTLQDGSTGTADVITSAPYTSVDDLKAAVDSAVTGEVLHVADGPILNGTFDIRGFHATLISGFNDLTKDDDVIITVTGTLQDDSSYSATIGSQAFSNSIDFQQELNALVSFELLS